MPDLLETPELEEVSSERGGIQTKMLTFRMRCRKAHTSRRPLASQVLRSSE